MCKVCEVLVVLVVDYGCVVEERCLCRKDGLGGWVVYIGEDDLEKSEGCECFTRPMKFNNP